MNAEVSAVLSTLDFFHTDSVLNFSTIHHRIRDKFKFAEFKSLWRNASVDHLDEKKIEEYLQKHGIDVMKDLAPKKVVAAPPKRKIARRRTNQKVHNEHLADVLEDYSN